VNKRCINQLATKWLKKERVEVGKYYSLVQIEKKKKKVKI
jgi:regulator of sigma D